MKYTLPSIAVSLVVLVTASQADQCLDKDDLCARFLRDEGKESFCQRPWARENCAASCDQCEDESTTTTTTPAPTTTTPTTTTTTPTTTTTTAIATICAKTDFSLPRQMAILHGDIQVLCDTETDGGKWVIFQQKRYYGDVEFSRDWDAYKSGFGELTPTGEFWLGLDTIHSLCGKVEDNCELRIDMKSGGSSFYVTYNTFYIGPESDNYRLRVSDYNGDAGDTLSDVNGKQFSTHDRDNDEVARHCVYDYASGWWFGSCEYDPDLNGDMYWGSNQVEYVNRSEMKFRRRATT